MTATESEVRHTTWWPGVALGMGVACVATFQQFKLPPVLPDLLRAHPHDPAVAAGFMSIYALVGLMVSHPLGRWLRGGVHRLGRGLFLAGCVTAIGCAVALARPDSAILFLTGRGLEGLGLALCAIAGPAIAAQAAAPRDLPLVMGILAAWVPVGQVVSALVAISFPDWRVLWWVGLVLALGLVVLGLRSAGAIARQSTLEAALTAHQKRLLWLAGSTFFLWSVQFFAFTTWLTLYLEIRYGLSLRQSIGIYILPFSVLLAFNIITGWALGRGVPLLRALIVGLVLQALVWIGAPFADTTWFGVALLLVYGFSAGVVPTCLFQVPHRIVGGTARAGAFSIIMTMRNVGVLLGPLLWGVLVDGPEDWPPTFALCAGIALSAAALTLVLRWRLMRA